MPTFQSQSFSCLVAEQLADLKLGLAEQCEKLAKEREQKFLDEIGVLRKENAELRAKLQAENGPPEPKLVQDPTALGAKSSTELLLATKVDVKAQEAGKGSKSADPEDVTVTDKGPFHLLPELLADPWTGDDVIDDHNGAYFERELHVEILVKKCVLDPGSNNKLCWDVLGIPILAWDLITIPMQVFTLGSMGDYVMDRAGWVTLIYWSLDMPVTFMTGFFDEEGGLIMDIRRIANHYMHGFFFLDLVIILGDWLTVVIESMGSDAPGFLANLSVLRVLRISRFVRLLRLRKLKAKIQTVEDSIDNEWLLVILNLVAKVLSILVVNHYICCGWYMLGSNDSIERPNYRWLTAVPYPQYNYPRDQRISDSPWHYQYLTSLHWAIAQFTPGPQNIQPQNSAERAYVIFVLLFGMVVFSSFIASVTQARMQLNKMMSKFERDNWLLRKFCRQHNISRELQTHMKRYIDLVIIPNFHKLTMADVVLLPKLSSHLREQLNTELTSQHLVVHPFFKQLQGMNRAVMSHVCNQALDQLSFARGDVAFSGGVIARCMLLVTSGVLDYIPLHPQCHEERKVSAKHWACEAVLWTKWTHQGQLQASIESTAMAINGVKFRTVITENGFVMSFVRTYGLRFCEGLSELWGDDGKPSDLHEHVAMDLDLSQFKANNFVWLGAQVGAMSGRITIPGL
jgi:hypothetical protein